MKNRVTKIMMLLTAAIFFTAGCSNSPDDAFDRSPPPPLMGYNGDFPVKIMGMVEVSGGSFELGKALGKGIRLSDGTYGPGADDTVVSTVTLTGFHIGKYQITQWQWQEVMTGNTNGINPNPSYFHGGRGREPFAGENQSKRPVENVSWYEAIVFCNRLSIIEDLDPAYSIKGSTDPDDWGPVPGSRNTIWDDVEIVSESTGYRLPTEAQWEYAAKGGSNNLNNHPGFTYAGSDNPNDVAWYDGNSGNRTHAVGLFSTKPNALGIYDMSGNVWEWCWDWWDSEYTEEAKTDPTGPSEPSSIAAHEGRVRRGGGCLDGTTSLRSINRNLYAPNYPFPRNGLRVVLPVVLP